MRSCFRPLPALGMAGLVLLGGVAPGGVAGAGACCSPEGGTSPGLLGPDEDRGLALTLGAGRWQGEWALDGDWVGHGDDQRAQERIAAEGLLRVYGPVQVAAGAGLLRQRVSLGGLEDAALGLDQVHGSLRWDGPRSGCAPHARRPAVRLGLGRRAPEATFGGGGRPTTEATLGLDWEGNLDRGRWGAGIEGQWSEAPTLRLDLRLGASPHDDLDVFGILSPSLGQGGARGLSLGLAAPWSASPRWRLVPSMMAAPPLSSLGRAQRGWLLAQLTLLHLHPRAG